jgi:hypothetical protein
VSIDFNHDAQQLDLRPDPDPGHRRHAWRVLSWYDNEWGFSNRMAGHYGGNVEGLAEPISDGRFGAGPVGAPPFVFLRIEGRWVAMMAGPMGADRHPQPCDARAAVAAADESA